MPGVRPQHLLQAQHAQQVAARSVAVGMLWLAGRCIQPTAAAATAAPAAAACDHRCSRYHFPPEDVNTTAFWGQCVLVAHTCIREAHMQGNHQRYHLLT